MSDVFLSYARNDRDRAQALAAALEARGLRVWWDREIVAGRSFEDMIQNELDRTRCVVVLWSEESIESDWVRNEAREGMERGILVPALLESVRMPLAFRHLQAADLTRGIGSGNDRELEELVHAVRTAIDPSGESPKAPAAPAPRRARHRIAGPALIAGAGLVVAGLAVYALVRTPPAPAPDREPSERAETTGVSEAPGTEPGGLTWSADDLSGVWTGRYTYDQLPGGIPASLQSPAAFTVALQQSGATVAGTIQEQSGLGMGPREATVREGRIEGSQLVFTKVYAGSGGMNEAVEYRGTLSSSGSNVEGSWSTPSGLHGTFEMRRD